MLTDDAFRRRELADLGIRAEVQSDGHTIVATFDRTQFDGLVRLAAFEDFEDVDEGPAYRAGYRDGVNAAKDAPEKATNKAAAS